MMAVCGLDCGRCDILLVPTDPKAAQRVVAWFHKMRWLEENKGIVEIIEREMYCKGCHVDRSVHWTPDCPLLICCVDERHLEHCGQCEEFVCEKLKVFANDGQQSHREAVERLKRIVKSSV